MNIKKLKVILFVISLITCVVSLIPGSVYANNVNGAVGGDPGHAGSWCPDCTWTYTYTGIRFSLYQYDGSNLSYYGSVDYCASGTCEGAYVYVADSVGKVAYQKLGYRADDSWNSTWLALGSNVNFNKNYIEYGYEGSGMNTAVESFLELNTNNNAAILSKVKQMFAQALNFSSEDLLKAYVTVEPTLKINEVGHGSYYGTAYELNTFFSDGAALGGETANYGGDSDDDWEGINGQVYHDIGINFRASRVIGNRDLYNFIGNMVNLVPTSQLYTNVWPRARTYERQMNANMITSQDGYGIVVYWLGNYVPVTYTPSCTITESADRARYTLNVSNPSNSTIYYDIKASASALNHYARNTVYTATFRDQSVIGKIYNSSGQEVATCSKTRSIPTCEQTCNGKSGDDLLGCAENYCQAMSTNSSQKKTCITTCGPNAPRDPGFTTCPSTDSGNGSDTECNASTTAYKETCTQATTRTYYKTECYERSTINYSNSLPVALSPGGGFSYTPVLSGGKTCEMTFESNKWKFDYAASYTDSERNTLVSILNKYNDVDQNSIWTQDLKDNYKYTSSNANIKIEITNDNDASATNRKTTKTLVPNETVNLLSNEIVVSSAGSVTIPLFNSGKTTKTVFGLVKTNSQNKTSYKLPGTCMTSGDGTLYDLGPGGTCDTDNDGPYYQYFTDMRIENDTYDTKVTVSKGSSSLNVNNTCYYNINTSGGEVSCSIAKVSNDKYELRIENKNMISNVTYGLSTTKDSLNMKLTYSGSVIGGVSLYGTVAVDGDKVATCELGSEGGSGSTCTSEYLPTDYSGIREYCSTSWMSDTAGYSSEKDCINSCSYGANTCKNNPDVDTTDLTSVTNFCSVKANRDSNGYNKATYSNSLMNEKHNIAMCINDCIDTQNTCTGITCDYLYRPISLVDPFPNNRRPGANWYGKEIYITDDLLNPVLNPSGAEPEYVITLTPSAINSINRDTDEYNSGSGKNAYLDYVYEDEDNKEGKYVSKFIHSTDEPNGGFRTYFSKIIGR